MTLCDRVGQSLDVARPRKKGLESGGGNPADGAEFVRRDHFALDPAANGARGNIEDVGHFLDCVIFLVHRPIRVLTVAERMRGAEGHPLDRRLGAAGTESLRGDSALSPLRRRRRRSGHGTIIEPRKPRFHLLDPFFEEHEAGRDSARGMKPGRPNPACSHHCPGDLLSRNGFSRSLAGNWSSLAMLSFAPVTGAPRIENGDALLVEIADRWCNFRNIHVWPNAP